MSSAEEFAQLRLKFTAVVTLLAKQRQGSKIALKVITTNSTGNCSATQSYTEKHGKIKKLLCFLSVSLWLSSYKCRVFGKVCH